VPILALIIFFTIIARLGQPIIALKQLCAVLLLGTIVYGLMFTDAHLNLWARQGWDYSTHTATAFACCWYLFWLPRGYSADQLPNAEKAAVEGIVARMVERAPTGMQKILSGVFENPVIQLIWPLSLIAYLILMRCQQYHTWVDMTSTLAALMPLFCLHFFATH
jgi:hypothetical protein